MAENILYGYTGLFDTPDQIIEAAQKVSSGGYTKFDINTPYPVHGMDNAMKLPPSKLGYAALVFGLSGTIAALAVMYWMSTIDYPIVIGGKPFFALPAFIPIMFEVTVLAASIATVLTMLFMLFKFPNNAHPLHDSEYMKKVSLDKYGVCIQASDPIFNDKSVQDFLKELGAKEISPLYYEKAFLSFSPKIFEPKFITLLAFTFALVSLITYITLNKLMFIQPFSWMMEQDKLTVQAKMDFFDTDYGMKKPVEGTVARGFLPYQFAGQPEEAAKYLKNSLVPSIENLKTGEAKYNTFCSPCHGYLGKGDSRLRGQFPNPPSLHSEKVINWSDGRIYHVLMEGQNVMPSYAKQMNTEEKWAVIHYVRALQRSLNAKESDLK